VPVIILSTQKYRIGEIIGEKNIPELNANEALQEE
jgi:hypothetical protein